MRIGRNGIFLALSLLLLFAREAHVSGSMEDIGLEELIHRSDAILLVRMGKPAVRRVKIAFPKPSKEHFDATEHAFEVVKEIRDEDSLVKGKTLRVLSASDEDNYEQSWNELRGRPVKMSIYTRYAGGISPEKEKRFIIFVRYNREARRFSFTASGAYEKEARLADILKAEP